MKLNVASVALNQIPLDWNGNQKRLEEAFANLHSQNVELACFPEMSICGYGCEDVFLADYLYEESLDILFSLLPKTEGLVAAIGLPLKVGQFRYSAAALVVDGEIAGFYCKKNLANDGLHYEHRWFEAWPEGEVSSVEIRGKSYPVGDLQFNVSGLTIGFEICEDAWVEKRFSGNQKPKCSSVILNPSASHFAFRKNIERRQLILDGSKEINGSYIYANMSSNEAGRIIYDGSNFVATKGELVAESERFSFDEVVVTTAVIEPALYEETKAGQVVVGYKFSQSSAAVSPVQKSILNQTEDEEFLLAETLGLFDYVRKSFSKGFILSLSGGVDSATCAVLIRHMVERAVNSLGIDGFKQRFAYFKEIQTAESVDEIMKSMLCCVYQATANSGPVTENAAESLAKEIGADYHFFNVDEVLEGYKDLVQGTMDRPLSWEKDDLALQNIQARVRAPGIWMVTNLRGGLLVTTSNRSEAAVGYATMDGDTSGGLCPLGGVDKTFLRRWLRSVEVNSLCGCEAIPALKFVNEQEPTAELRPSDQEQKDEEDLMPYEVLDFIEKASIRDKKSPSRIFTEVVDTYKVDKAQAFTWIEKFYRLWSRNQWKRERYAPAFHMDDENLDPKTWCRFPILSGGYQRELSRIKSENGL
ncbi:MAG: NAD(+) synthase [Lentisphaeraceae bacterium]|nr:NAD(+) synthase [Lentisphaeraceae bacterium]